MVLDLACKGPKKVLLPPHKVCPHPTCFQREERDNLVVVSFPIVSFSETGSLCTEIKLELIAGHASKLKTTNNDKDIPRWFGRSTNTGGLFCWIKCL